MSYFMRYTSAEYPPPSLEELQTVLRDVDSAYMIIMDDAEPSIGDLYYGDDVYAELEVNLPGDPLCDEDIADLAEEIAEQDDPNREFVLDVLQQAMGIVVIHVLRAGHEDYPPLGVLVQYLFDHYGGLLQVDEEGFFNRDGRVIALL